ncbi:cysteine peptidase family C39 domain-containing protein [Fulvivirga ligni]|uniref:cysteine peptidase family C39 domain-containing protein n=1 Tax=Fulvivirga ligni TaxID=2904246 RepID=UPI001F161EA2|nr:cysteine peptidase family C39 domain-containing protein [Fulvivirga ligni]UII21565.1 cysteine peptidase family C39 domain-containing protein [Fulvivirga ligni]
MDVMLLKALKSYFKAVQIKVSPEELELQLYSNPHTPSLFAISETLDFLGIDNVAAKVEIDQLDELPDHFIAFIDGDDGSPYFSHVHKKNDEVYLVNEKRRLEGGKFRQLWGGVILVAEQQGGREFHNTKSINISIALMVALLLILFWEKSHLLVFSCLALLGLYISMEIFATANNRSTNFGQKVCGSKDGDGCDKILRSEKYNLGSYTLNDALFAFLHSNLILLLLKQDLGWAHVISYALAMLTLTLTMGIQAFVLKTWCRLCLLSSGIILIQGILIFFLFWNNLDSQNFFVLPIISELGLLGVIFGISLIVVSDYRGTLKKKLSFDSFRDGSPQI